MYGVSPAWFVARYGSNFTVEQSIRDFKVIKSAGFDSVQLELFFEDKLSEWSDSSVSSIISSLNDADLKVSQFVAHYLNEAFSTKEKMFTRWGFETFKKTIKILKTMQVTDLITVPVGKFIDNEISASDYDKIDAEYAAMLSEITGICEDNGFRAAVEIIPFSIMGNINGFMRYRDYYGINGLNLCLDTKHSLFTRDNISYYIKLLGNSIVSTHLCDNKEIVNESGVPGSGSIDWDSTFDALNAINYKGSYDLEIICPAEKSEQIYKDGLTYIKQKRRRHK